MLFINISAPKERVPAMKQMSSNALIITKPRTDCLSVRNCVANEFFRGPAFPQDLAWILAEICQQTLFNSNPSLEIRSQQTGLNVTVDKLIIGLTGMPGSGKSLVVETAKTIGYEVVTMGDVIREETTKRGLELNPKNVGKVMLQLRAEGGDRVIAERCLPKIGQKKSKKIIIDGLRSHIEVDTFKKALTNFVMLTVHASPQARFERLSTRARSDDPKTWEVFEERDMRELRVGIGDAIALAEYVIINDSTKEVLNVRTTEVLKKAEKEWIR